MLAQLEQGVEMALDHGDAFKGCRQGILGGLPAIDGGPAQVSQTVAESLESL